jgi:prepilin-type N-terminal cleavage/methylation domain-containing protein
MHRRTARLAAARQRGFNLVELMIALVIGAFLIGGALTVFVQGSQTQRVGQGLSRLQENTRFALGTLVPDVRLAGLWGRTHVTATIDGRKGAVTQLAALASGDCAARWYIDLNNFVEAYNDDNPWDATCLDDDDYVAETDVLVVRHASTVTSGATEAGRIYVRSDNSHGELFEGPTVPTAGYASTVENRDLVTHAYYIRPWSFVDGDGIPSLRRLVLTDGGSDPALIDEVVVEGIEDLQVQFGVDSNEDGSVDMYLDPDSAQFNVGELRAVRIWLLARAESVEQDFTDDATYAYATKTYTPNDGFRRLLVSTTVLLRNTNPTE